MPELNLVSSMQSPTFLGNFCKVVKIYHFSSEIILGIFYRHLAIFFWSHCMQCKPKMKGKLVYPKVKTLTMLKTTGNA